jgi:predicted MFS family arabinose efflux permease
VLAALAANLVGIGLARFAYTPLLPALIEAGWFPAADAAYLGAANLAGYLAGALLTPWAAARAPAAALLRAAMALAALSFFASAWPLSFAWYFLWRFAAGATGGVLMALAAPAVLPLVPPGRQGLAGGVIFTGVGLGIAASGTAVPLLLRLGLAETWCGLGLVAAALTALAWNAWPRAAMASETPRPALTAAGGALRVLLLRYGLIAAGLVPHMLFLVDFVARGLGRGLDSGSAFWVLFGLGAVVGPVLAGRLADRVGFRPALGLALALEALAVAAPAIDDSTVVLAASSLLVGAFVPGVVPLVLGRVRELLAGDAARQRAAWSRATAAFALGQAAGAYAFSFAFEAGAAYALLFAAAAGAMALALVLELAAGPAPTGATAAGSALMRRKGDAQQGGPRP